MRQTNAVPRRGRLDAARPPPVHAPRFSPRPVTAVLTPPPAASPPWPDGLDPDRPPAVLPPMSRDEYLAFDNAASTGEFKYEWVDGKVRAMTGVTANHYDVVGNLVFLLNQTLRQRYASGGRKMRCGGSDMRTRIPGGPYYYPDVIVRPIPSEMEEPPDEPQRTLLNPVLVVEVLSPSTARVDRGEKRREYLRIPTLENYLIVQPNVREVLRLTRDASDPNRPRWGERRFRDGEDVDLPRLGVALPMAEIYEDCTPGERID